MHTPLEYYMPEQFCSITMEMGGVDGDCSGDCGSGGSACDGDCSG